MGERPNRERQAERCVGVASMTSMDEMGRKLEQIRLVAILDPADATKLYREVLKAIESVGLVALPRAEGHAFFPSQEVPALRIPHLRLAHYGDRVMVWVRSPYDLNEQRARLAGFPAEGIYRRMVLAAKKAADVFEAHRRLASVVQISLPR